MFEPLAALDRHATQRSHAIAVATPSRSYTFAQLRHTSTAVAAHLRAAGITQGMTVGVDLPGALEWIVDLALFRLGVRSVSLRGVQPSAVLRPDALVAEPTSSAWRAPLVIELDHQVLDSLPEATVEPVEFDDPIFRLLMTGGTTGASRAAAYSIDAMMYRLAYGHVHWTNTRPELTMIGLSTTGGFHAALACLLLGVPYLSIDSIDLGSMTFAAGQGIRVLCGSPTQLAHAVHTLTASGLRLPALEEVRVAGAGPSAALLEMLIHTLRVPVVSVYGSTEGGGVSMVTLDNDSDRFAIGAPLADVELEIVDDTGAPVPTGTEGSIRYRTPGLVSGYMIDGVIQPLVGGWFAPGDRGTFATDGTVTLGGRDSELFNIGGLKLDPVRVDDLALAFAGIRDAAAFTVERIAGIAEVGLAVVSDDECDLRALDHELRALLPIGHPTAFWRVDEIPRGRLGKPLRAQLTSEFAAR